MTNYMSLAKAKTIMAEVSKNVEEITTEIKKVENIDDILTILDYNPTPNYRINSFGNRLGDKSSVKDTLIEINKDMSENITLSRMPKDELKKESQEYITDEYIKAYFNRQGRYAYRQIINHYRNKYSSSDSKEYQELPMKIAKDWVDKMSSKYFLKSDYLKEKISFKSSKFRIIGGKHSNFAEEVLESLNEGDNLKLFHYNDGQASEVVKNIITIDLSGKNN